MTHVRCSPDAAFKLQLTTVLQLCQMIDSPRSLTVYLLLSAGENRQYLDLTTDPNHYSLTSAFADDYLVTEALRKSPYLPVDIDRRAVALESFWTSELQCMYTNIRLREQFPSFGLELSREISRILGPLSSQALEFIERKMRHGPGTCIGFVADGNVQSKKFDENITLTIDLYPYYKSILGPLWHDKATKKAKIVGGNRFVTVPKDAKTDRGICTEPMLNVFGQLGIGAYIKSRLAKFGFDLSTQQERNREFAARAHVDGLCTIDLSRASDTLASSVIKYFFPPDWLELLDLFRSKRTKVDGEYFEIEKFSSMGNGYTFELETLVFLALARTVVPQADQKDIAVFGDDIILPSKYGDEMIKRLKVLGFQTNGRKTFLDGKFFESCGTDWFNGVNVRPFYLREFHDGAPAAVQIANRLRLYAQRRGGLFGSPSRYRAIWRHLVHQAPPLWRTFRVPPAAGDSGIIMSLNEAKPRNNVNGWEGWRYRCATTKPIYRRSNGSSLLLLSLMHDGSTNFKKNREPIKGFLGRIVPKWVSCFSWPDGLGWDNLS